LLLEWEITPGLRARRESGNFCGGIADFADAMSRE
jgi:hypothetical protein